MEENTVFNNPPVAKEGPVNPQTPPVVVPLSQQPIAPAPSAIVPPPVQLPKAAQPPPPPAIPLQDSPPGFPIAKILKILGGVLVAIVLVFIIVRFVIPLFSSNKKGN